MRGNGHHSSPSLPLALSLPRNSPHTSLVVLEICQKHHSSSTPHTLSFLLLPRRKNPANNLHLLHIKPTLIFGSCSIPNCRHPTTVVQPRSCPNTTPNFLHAAAGQNNTQPSKPAIHHHRPTSLVLIEGSPKPSFSPLFWSSKAAKNNPMLSPFHVANKTQQNTTLISPFGCQSQPKTAAKQPPNCHRSAAQEHLCGSAKQVKKTAPLASVLSRKPSRKTPEILHKTVPLILF